MTRLILIFLIITITSCGTVKNSDNLTSWDDTIIVFNDYVKVIGQHSDEFGGTSFNPISVVYKNKLIFKDSLNEYWLTGFDSDQYPKFFNCADGNYQLLIEVDERPNQNELMRLTISEDGKARQDRLPIFYWAPTDIDNDGKLEVSGILTNGETIADGDTAFYNPILVYEITANCLEFDSTTTIEKNKKIWGQFHGYCYNDTLLLPFIRTNYD